MSLRSYLRRRQQLEIAEMQDIVLSILLEVLDSPPIMHGGTVIWRVFKSPRFSEDLSFYAQNIGEDLRGILEKELHAFSLTLPKFRETRRAVFLEVLGRRKLRVELIKERWSFREVEAEYELVNGGFIIVRTLVPRDLLLEKIWAYKNRRKARDLFDIYYLLNIVEEVPEEIREILPLLQEPPKDWRELRVLIIRGLPPSFELVKRKILQVTK